MYLPYLIPHGRMGLRTLGTHRQLHSKPALSGRPARRDPNEPEQTPPPLGQLKPVHSLICPVGSPSSHLSSGNLAYDFWRFNPNSVDSSISWIRLRDIFNTSAGTYDDGYSNIVRKNGASFVILGTANGDKGYITLGANTSTAVNFTWEYDFNSDTWTEKAPYKGTARSGPVGFNVLNRGFVATGLNAGAQAAYSDCYEFFPNQVYNPND